MKVSVLIITYNHEKFIAQAIESVLMQEVEFEYEIVIGEDCSTDRTREIVSEYARKYPDKIRTIFRHHNLGYYGYKNFVESYKTCKGNYVAYLDGDDYWTFPKKLQKQVDFLDTHPDYVMCFHDAIMSYEDGSEEPHNYCPIELKETLEIEDLLVNCDIVTSSVIFRKEAIVDFPDWFYTLMWSDWAFYILIAEYGKIGYIKDRMAVYRFHSGGVSYSLGKIETVQEILNLFNHINRHFSGKYKKIIKRRIYHYLIYLTMHDKQSSDSAIARAAYVFKRYTEFDLSLSLFETLRYKVLLRIFAPRLFSLLKVLKSMNILPIM